MNIGSINICDDDTSFELTMQVPPDYCEGVKGYVQAFTCNLLYSIYENDDQEGISKVIGQLSGYRFLLNDCLEYEVFNDKIKNPLSIRDLFEMINDDTERLLFLFDGSSSLKPTYQKKFGYPIQYDLPNIIFIQKVQLLSAYRGQGFGEALISNSICTVGKEEDVVILKLFPLQFDATTKKEKSEWNTEMDFTSFAQDEEIARQKLAQYYKKLGFKKLNQDGFLYSICKAKSYL